jgi:hypothetical protein
MWVRLVIVDNSASVVISRARERYLSCFGFGAGAEDS